MITLKNINYFYNHKEEVLKDISLSLKKGKIISLLGPSGCGKSTLLRILIGFEKQASGTICLNHQEYPLHSWDERQNVFSLMPQMPLLLPWKTIFSNVFLASHKELKKEERKQQTLDVLKLVNLEEHVHKYPTQISLGMAQRASFARALLQQTPALLLDEPFASLDAVTRKHLQIWLKEKINATQKYALLVTHDIREALFLSEEIFVLSPMPAQIIEKFQRQEEDLWIAKNDHFSCQALEEKIFHTLSQIMLES